MQGAENTEGHTVTPLLTIKRSLIQMFCSLPRLMQTSAFVTMVTSVWRELHPQSLEKNWLPPFHLQLLLFTRWNNGAAVCLT